MSIKENLNSLKNQIPEHITLVAVSKTKPVEDILQAYNAGHRVFGENKVQEMVDKFHSLPNDIKWHMIGHLQRNKVKYIAGFVDLIHGVDNLKLLKEINKQGLKNDRIINCLIQIKIATEDSKFGMSINEAKELITSEEFKNLENISIKGVMGMATFTDDKRQIKNEFESLDKGFNELKTSLNDMTTISMGMSGDYNIAIDAGSTMIRVGSSIFGSRQYQ